MAKQPYHRKFQNKGFQSGPRKNERIRAKEVRVINQEGDQVGIMPIERAIQLARQAGYDLVEISANANPPVCRILDFGKYMYEQSKKNKDGKGATSKIKEVKFHVRTDEHDYVTKLRHGEEFLEKGNKLKLTLTFRGREMEYKELGFDVVKRAISDLSNVGSVESAPRLAGRNITAMLTPLPANKRKPRFIDQHPQPRQDQKESRPNQEQRPLQQQEQSTDLHTTVARQK